MHGWGVFFFLLLLAVIFGAVGWIAYTQIRARRQGLPPPSWQSYIPFMHASSASTTNYPTPRSSNPLEWLKDQLAKLSNKRTARGAYEETGSATDAYPAATAASAGRRGRGLEDDAWDTRVGGGIEDPYDRESGPYYHEEAELGLAPTPGLVSEPYGGATDYTGAGGGGGGGGGGGERGRTQNRSAAQNPFGDENATGLRDVSPRPVETGASAGHLKGHGSLSGTAESPTERRSMFHEGL